MSNAPVYDIDPVVFHADPYPDLAKMRAEAPIAYVPQLGATLLTRRNTIFEQEKRVDVFSSRQPNGLMTRLMGENMMRKDGTAHAAERRACFPALSPRTVRDVWAPLFRRDTGALLDDIAPQGSCDLVKDIAMPISGHALRHITGLTCFTPAEMDSVSQAMIDGIANYAGDPHVEARCDAATTKIDDAIAATREPDEHSLIAVQRAAGLSAASVHANVKLAISGGQNEPRDAVAGAAWALMTHPEQLQAVQSGAVPWLNAFEEYARWISPIGMSPREIAREDTVDGVTFGPGERAFLMFGSGNRDESVFDTPDRFDVRRDTRHALSFGAGPHFCAGAAASRVLIADVALPMLFDRLPGLRLTGPVPFVGWAFRGPTVMPVAWNA